MTGPEHYRHAERLLASATLSGTHPDGSPLIRSDEPHALAASQALDRGDGRQPVRDRDAWYDVAGTKPDGGAA